MLCSTFMQALEHLGCPWAAETGTGGLLCAALDFYGCGFISREDLEWLDRWPVSEWLSAAPDAAAWEELRRLMLASHGRPLRVWRSLLDKDNSNLVTWVEFQEACQAVGFRGDIGGAWCHLDQDTSGTISLQEFDPHTAEMLVSFKAWVQDHFGTVEFAFRSLDTDGSGSVSFSELKRGCMRLKWEGDAREIFDCLDQDAGAERQTLSYKELEFLDSWEPNPWVWEEAERISQAGRSVRRFTTMTGRGSMSLPKLPSPDCPSPASGDANPTTQTSSSPPLTVREDSPRKLARLRQRRGGKASSPYAAPLVPTSPLKLLREGLEGRGERVMTKTFSMPALATTAACGEKLGAKDRLLVPVLTGCDEAAERGRFRMIAKLRRSWAGGDKTAALPFAMPSLSNTWRDKAAGLGGRAEGALGGASPSRTSFEVISGRAVALAVAPG
mmetsp:Transcript_118580/g.369379  ORF Transcript_118580/g.369379 Transcript_118580/m.369379 type:complete len:442 (-) Transcript_118580:75-1400(-)